MVPVGIVTAAGIYPTRISGISTADSREKRFSVKDKLPVCELYTGKHIPVVLALAQERQTPFFVLSARHGFIGEKEEIEPYDHLLIYEGVPELVGRVVTQLRQQGIKELQFYTKDSPHWWPYRDAIKAAARLANVKLTVHTITPEDKIEPG